MSTRFYSICCHCQTKTVFDTLDQLKCESCGAPLSEFHKIENATPKAEPVIVERIVEREIIREVPVPREGSKISEKKTSKMRKKKKSKIKRFVDFAEDIFDIFD